MSPTWDISFFHAKKTMRNFIKLTKRRENNIMATWQKEIMVLANDFCLNMEKVKGIVRNIDAITVPKGKSESNYKYDRAYSMIKPMLMNI